MNSSSQAEAVRLLTTLGLTETEGLIYCALLRQPSATGYGLGQSIGKAHANVYQALTALVAKGAVILEEGAKKAYRAVPPAEFIAALRRKAEQSCDAAAESLARLEIKAPDEDRFYRLGSREQVLARARLLIEGAQGTILVQSFPMPLDEIREDLVRARDRGVRVAGLVFRPEDAIPDTNFVVSRIADRVMGAWAHPHMTLVADGREFLLALFDGATGELRRSVWVNSLYVATIFHNGIVADTILHGDPLIDRIGSPANYLFGGFPPSFDELFEQS